MPLLKINRLALVSFWQQFQSRIATADALPQLAFLGFIIGIGSGIIIILFRLAIEVPLSALLPGNVDNFEGLVGWQRWLLPLGGSLIIGWMLFKRTSTARNVGISHVLDRLENHQGQLPLSNAWFQAIGATVACITGQSTGREGPAVHLGAALASGLGARLQLPKNRTRTLIGCGVAGAISASFNVPLAGVIFALEVVLKEYTVAGFIPILMSAVVAALLSSGVFGSAPAFDIPTTDTVAVGDMAYLALISAAIGVLAASFNYLSVLCLRRCPSDPRLAMLILGLVTATCGLAFPQILGIGYDSIHQIVSNPWGWFFLIAFIGVKIAVTALACGFGLPGGIIGPILILGTATGVLFGTLAHSVAPESAASMGLYALMGMGAMMAAVLQAPLAALVALLEMTQNPTLLLPAMLSVIIAPMVASEIFKRKSIFVELLSERGISLEQHPAAALLRNTSVTALMRKNFVTSPGKIHLEEAEALLTQAPKWLLLTAQHPLYTLVPASDLGRLLQDPKLREDYVDAENQTLDLMQIPAQRLSAYILSYRAHLEDALNTMNQQQVDAVCIEANWASHKEPIGVVLLSQINSYYQYSPRKENRHVVD